MILSGTVVKADLGPGVLMLETADGKRYALTGATNRLEAGARVSVKGLLEGDAVGIGMTGDPVFNVAMHTPLD